MPFISIIIPTYNRALLLKRCLKSVLAISNPDVEILVSDNASEDNTQEMLNSITDKRLVFWKNETNIGIENNILGLLKSAKGDWIFCLTDDDYLLPGGLERLLAIIQSDASIGVILSSLAVVDITEKPLWIYRFHNETKKFSPGLDSLTNMVVAAHVFSRILVRREWIDIVGMERTMGSMYPQMYMVGSILREHSGYYLQECAVAHTAGNETAWDYPVDFMVGARIKMIKDLLPVPQWAQERNALMSQLIEEIRISHMPLSRQKSMFTFINHQRILLHYPEIAYSTKYWRNLFSFLLNPNMNKVRGNLKNIIRLLYSVVYKNITSEDVKMKLKDFIPPIFTRSLKKLLISKNETSSPKFFLAYSEAKDASYGAGYEDADLVETVFEKTRLNKEQMLNGKFPLSDSTTQSLLAVLFSLQHGRLRKQFKVIDFGGAFGAHYFQIRPFCPPGIQVDWMVVETPAIVKKAKAFETGELHFVTSILEAKEKLQNVNLLHSSGALQYVPNPQVTIREFMMSQSNYIFLNRLALSASETLITVQETFLSANGPGALPDGLRDKLCRYPVTYFPKRHFEAILSQNYKVILEFVDTKINIGEKEIFTNTSIFAERSQ